MKAQVDAPVELVIAVIIMIMSTALAFMLINQTNEDKCLAELKTQTDSLQSVMLDVALASPPTSRTVVFRPIECGSQTIAALQFVYYSDPAFCGLCASKFGGCWQIIPVAREQTGAVQRFVPLYKSISCVNMAGNVVLQNDGSCSTAEIVPEPNTEGDIASWGIPTSVWDKTVITSTDDPNPSRWQTLKIDRGVGAYDITLTKSAGALGSGTEQGVIKICIKKIGR